MAPMCQISLLAREKSVKFEINYSYATIMIAGICRAVAKI